MEEKETIQSDETLTETFAKEDEGLKMTIILGKSGGTDLQGLFTDLSAGWSIKEAKYYDEDQIIEFDLVK